jgi:hypothetical protein
MTGIALNLRRADNLIGLSLLVNLMMTGLAVSVLAIVLQVTTAKGQFDLVPLSMSLSLIFGLLALRNVQPGVPPVGAFSGGVGGSHGLAVGAASASQVRILTV